MDIKKIDETTKYKSQNANETIAKKVLKKLLDKLMLLVTALAIFGVIIGIVWYFTTADLREIERKNKADPVYQKAMAEIAEKDKAEKEIQKKLDKLDKKRQAEEKAIADFEKSVRGKYNREYLLSKIPSDIKLANRLVAMNGYDCMNYWCASHDWEDDLCYDELSYYVFQNEGCAKKAFKELKESWIDRETDSGKNYAQGWETGVLDAEVEVFIYQTDNMIVTAELQVASGWAEPEDGDDSNSVVGFYYRKDFIKDRF